MQTQRFLAAGAALCVVPFASACGGDDATFSVADFASAICDATKAAQERYSEIDVALGGAEPGTEAYRSAVIDFLSSTADIVTSYAEINDTETLAGDDAEAFQQHFAAEMSYTKERVGKYIEALREAEAPVVDLNEVLDDVSMAVDYGATTVGQQVRQEMRTCDLGAS